MYDFLLKGDKASGIRLMPDDMVFVIPIGSMVGITGNVKESAIYELNDEKMLKDLIGFA